MVGNDPKDPAALTRRLVVVLTPLGSAWLSWTVRTKPLDTKIRTQRELKQGQGIRYGNAQRPSSIFKERDIHPIVG